MYTRAVEKSTPTLAGWIRRDNENGMIWTRLTKEQNCVLRNKGSPSVMTASFVAKM